MDNREANTQGNASKAATTIIAESLRDAYTFAQECVVGGQEELAYTVWIKVGNQSFCIDGYQDTKEEADWMRLMIGKAIQTLLSEQGVSSPAAGASSENLAASSTELEEIARETVKQIHLIPCTAYISYTDWEESVQEPAIKLILTALTKASTKLEALLEIKKAAHEWSAGYPLQGNHSHADHNAAMHVYRLCENFTKASSLKPKTLEET